MTSDPLADAARLSNQELIERVQALARREREASTTLIAHLAVLDGRRLYLAEGCSSLFTYCVRVLRFSEHAAYGRIEAVRAVRRFPVILEMLGEGSLNLTTVCILGPALTGENHHGLLEAAKWKRTRQVQEIVARIKPKPLVPSIVRKLPDRVEPPAVQVDPQAAERRNEPESPSFSLTTPPLVRADVSPLAPERYKVQFTATAQGYENLRTAQELLRHQIPNGDVGPVIEKALAVLVGELRKRKAGLTDRPRHMSRAEASRSRNIPAEVKRNVWARDEGQCAFVAKDGRRCDERGFLEYHHVVPYAAGGTATEENIQLRCRAHNGYEAELHFGLRKAEPEFRKVWKLGL